MAASQGQRRLRFRSTGRTLKPQIPNPKFQGNPKLKSQRLDLFGAWDLEVGISSRVVGAGARVRDGGPDEVRLSNRVHRKR